MDPCLSLRCVALLELSASALDSIEFVFGSIYFIFSEQLILGTDHACNCWQFLHLNSWAFRHELALKDAVDTNSSIIAERDRLSPCVALFEKDVFEVGLDEGVLNRITVIIESLHHIFAPASAEL